MKNKSEIDKRVKNVTDNEFRSLVQAKKIRGASLEDVNGTHHKRSLYIHPNTKQYWVDVK